MQSNPPTLGDFLSYVELGRPCDVSTPEARRMAEGISVTATLAQARARVRSGLVPGSHIAELEIPDGSAITFARTGKGRGHHTLWGDPSALMACVASVVPADAVD